MKQSWIAVVLAWCALWYGVHAAAANRLVDATSPYLLSHANDRVPWQPWSPEALAQAKREDKLIFLSIGYASCHWCHKMRRDTFAQVEVADYLNRHYITLLVDREERPDLDSYYMQVAEGMNGEGGWPLNVVLTPTQLPLFASSYLPPRPRFGLPGLSDVLEKIQTAWQQDRATLLRDEAHIRAQLKALVAPPHKGSEPGAAAVDPRERAVAHWMARWDHRYGGVGRAAKFLRPEVLSLVLRRAVQVNDAALADAVLFTLDRMAAGGVRDQLGGAFHRYSADRFWQVPHFEIMLYDNALMARVYLEAFQLAQRPDDAFVARQILDDLLRRFRQPDGGFAASLDADSQDEKGQTGEGFFYSWHSDDILERLGATQGASFLTAFLDATRGTIEGRGILRLQDGSVRLMAQHQVWQKSLRVLAEARAERAPPAVDDKVITSWNGLTVGVFAQAARILEDERYLHVAQETMRGLLVRPWKDGTLRHVRRGDRVGASVFLEDYAGLIHGLLALYEADFDLAHLIKARDLADRLLARFQGEEGRLFFMLPKGNDATVANQVLWANQNGLPSGNAMAVTSLARLALFEWDEAFQAKTAALLRNVRDMLAIEGYRAPELLRALDYQTEEAREIVFVGPRHTQAARRLLHEVHTRLLPGTIVAWADTHHPPDPVRWPSLNRPMVENKPTAYVCIKAVCKQPVTEPDALARQLGQREWK